MLYNAFMIVKERLPYDKISDYRNYLFLYLLLGIPVLLIEGLIAKVNRQASDYQCLRLVQWTFRLMLKVAGVEVTVIGEGKCAGRAGPLYRESQKLFDILLTYSRCKG